MKISYDFSHGTGQYRGIKNPKLWVTDHTSMPAVLIEPFFCDSQLDFTVRKLRTCYCNLSNCKLRHTTFKFK